jgi:signal transduction histidine kinase
MSREHRQPFFWNLLSNTIKFTPMNGKVQVLLELVDSQVEMTVIDTGEGIAPEFLPLSLNGFNRVMRRQLVDMADWGSDWL